MKHLDVAETALPDKRDALLADYISESTLAAELGEHLRTTARRRAAGAGPAFVVIARQIFYRRQAVTAWLLEQENQLAPSPRSQSPVRRRRRLLSTRAQSEKSI